MNMFLDVINFHHKFNLHSYGELDQEMERLRVTQMLEEINEFLVARQSGDREKQLDALIDLVYFALGTAYLLEFEFPRGWAKVQEANMQKIRAKFSSESKRESDYDVIKPPGWQAPDLSDCV